MSSIDLISLQIQIFGGNLFKNPGKVNFFVPFSFYFLTLHNSWILTHKILFFTFFCQLNINRNRCIEQILFYFCLICYCTRKVVYVFVFSFLCIKWKRQRKKEKWQKIWPSYTGIQPKILNKTFLPKIWILREIRSIELTVLKKSRL